jgi:predicted peptidase
MALEFHPHLPPRSTMCLLLLVTLLLSLMAPSRATAAEAQSVASFERTITKTVGYHYLLHLPAGYDARAERVWPLIVFLHGSGERGADPWLVAKHGPPKLLRAGSPAPANKTAEAAARRTEASRFLAANFIVVSPQCPAGLWWDDDAVLALADEIVKQHKVDTRRVYLTGLSMGGFGTWSVGLKNPGRFAAIVPICGGGQRIDVMRSARERKAELQSLGVWGFHGAKDPTVPIEESESMVAALKKAGVTDLQFTVYPEAKHDSWTESYANPDLYTWLLQHQR